MSGKALTYPLLHICGALTPIMLIPNQIVLSLPLLGAVAAFNEGLAARMLTMVTLRGVTVEDAQVAHQSWCSLQLSS